MSEAPIHILRGARRARPGAVATPSPGDTTHAPALSESPVSVSGVLVSDSQRASRKHNSHTSVRNESPPFLRRSLISKKQSAKAYEPSAAPCSDERRPYFCDGRASPSPGNSKRQRRSELSGRRFFARICIPLSGRAGAGRYATSFNTPEANAPAKELSPPCLRRARPSALRW